EKQGIKVAFLGDSLKFANPANILERLINKIQKHLLTLKVIKKEKPHILHTHLEVNEYVVPLNIKGKKIKLFYTLHNELDVLFGKGHFRRKKTTEYCIKRKGMIP